MATFPSDRFDEIPKDLQRAGAHRGERRRGSGWIAFAWAALATGVLVAAGVLTLGILNDSIKLPDGLGDTAGVTSAAPDPASTPTAEPTLDPEAAITVLNGTETVGLAARVGQSLRDTGWAGVGSTANASATDFTTTTVYYIDPAQEAAARGLARSLLEQATADATANGVTLSITEVRVEQSDQFQGAQITVVLGADFTGPVAAAGPDDGPGQ